MKVFITAAMTSRRAANWFAKTQHHKLFYHKLGTPQSQDKLIWRRKRRGATSVLISQTTNVSWW